MQLIEYEGGGMSVKVQRMYRQDRPEYGVSNVRSAGLWTFGWFCTDNRGEKSILLVLSNTD